MKEKIIAILSVIMFVTGLALCLVVIEQYRIESVTLTTRQLRAEVNEMYSSVTTTEIEHKKSEEENTDSEKLKVRIKNKQSICDEHVLFQLSTGERNAYKLASQKINIILKDVEANEIDFWVALVSSEKILHEAEKYKDIIDEPYTHDPIAFRNVDKLCFLSIFLIITGAVGVLIFILRHRKNKSISATE